jgi:hypothetical protein
MCLTCGCGDPDRRQRPTDITVTDLDRAATGSHKRLSDVVRNLRVSCERLEAKEAGLPTTRAALPVPAGRRS